jgi:hypothetical protein
MTAYTKRQTYLNSYSIGIVTEDNDQGKDVIKLWLAEDMPAVTGKLKDIKQEMKVKVKDAMGNSRESKSTSKAVIEAKWFQDGDNNRSTPPYVYKNESVLVFRYADDDTYYWRAIFHEPKHRKLEVAKYSYSNIPNTKAQALTEFTDSTSYYTKFDTINKKVLLHTANNDGEKTTYDFSIDALNGNWMMTDGFGNYIAMDSILQKVTIKTNVQVEITTPLFTWNGAKVCAGYC